MTVGCCGSALQDSSGKCPKWTSLQLQLLKLTNTSTKLRVHTGFQRCVQIVFHMFGHSNGLHLLNKLRHRDLDGFTIVFLTQLSTTKSKSTLLPGSKFKFCPKPLNSFLKSKIPTTNQIINMDSQVHLKHFSVVSSEPSEFQEHVTQRNHQQVTQRSRQQITQRNRQQLLSTWLVHRQGQHLSLDWPQGESKYTGPFAVAQNQLVEGLA